MKYIIPLPVHIVSQSEKNIRKNIYKLLKKENILSDSLWKIFLIVQDQRKSQKNKYTQDIYTQIHATLYNEETFDEFLETLLLPKGVFLHLILLELLVCIHAKTLQQDELQKISKYWIHQANEHGLWELRYLIEDSIFFFQYPKEYNHISKLIEKIEKKYATTFQDIETIVQHQLQNTGICNYKMQYRRKNLYGIWKKISLKNASINNLHDILGLRIIVSNERECYQVVEILKKLWPEFSGHFKDYITTPKLNNYQSIHITLLCLYKTIVEFQIRSFDMDRIAKYGAANHAFYKKSQGDIDKNT